MFEARSGGNATVGCNIKRDMRFHKSLLSLFGLFLIAIGIVLNILMFALLWWPTYLFFISMAVGLLFYVIDIPIRRSQKLSITQKVLIQLTIIIVPIAAIYIKTQIINPRAEVIIASDNFTGPYLVVYGLKGKKKLPREGRDIVVRLPENGILLTSSDVDETPNLFETYVSKGSEKYGTRVFTDLEGAGKAMSADCSLAFDYRAGYFINPGDTSAKNYDMNGFIMRVHDSLCKTFNITNAAANSSFKK